MKYKLTIKAEIELELTQEDVDHIKNDKDLNGLTVPEFYETYYKTELEDLAKKNKGVKTNCIVSEYLPKG